MILLSLVVDRLWAWLCRFRRRRLTHTNHRRLCIHMSLLQIIRRIRRIQVMRRLCHMTGDSHRRLRRATCLRPAPCRGMVIWLSGG